ncbi:MAG: hypothetical protein KKD83_03820 [Chloroflexi bacterium]|nr:hypothetical protein [Chloroflexota bacterium]
MKAWRCIKCEQKIKIVAQRPAEEAYNYGEFPRWVQMHAGEVDRGASGIKLEVKDIEGFVARGRLCERCIDELVEKNLLNVTGGG